MNNNDFFAFLLAAAGLGFALGALMTCSTNDISADKIRAAEKACIDIQSELSSIQFDGDFQCNNAFSANTYRIDKH